MGIGVREPASWAHAAVLADLERELGPLAVLTTYHRDPVVAVGDGVVVHVASGEAARATLRREQACRAWAAARGVPVPEVVHVAPDGGALVSRRVRRDPPEGVAFVQAAAAAAQGISDADEAPPSHGRTWSAGRRGRVRRVVRTVVSPVRVGEFRAVRARAAALPRDGWAHGDFRRRNVPFDASTGRVAVLDWEFLGPAWRGTDLLSLAAVVVDDATSDMLVEAAVELRGRAEAADVGTVLLWQAVRTLAERATGVPLRQRDTAQVRETVLLVERARRTAARLGSPTG